MSEHIKGKTAGYLDSRSSNHLLPLSVILLLYVVDLDPAVSLGVAAMEADPPILVVDAG